jgi:prevent-host-death family protein
MAIELSVSAARGRLGEVLDGARVGHTPVFLTRHGKRVGVLCGIADWEALAGQSAKAPPDEAAGRIATQIEALAERATALIRPGTAPLVDASAYYETRAPRR